MSTVVKYAQIDCKRRFTVTFLSGKNNSSFVLKKYRIKKMFKTYFLNLK